MVNNTVRNLGLSVLVVVVVIGSNLFGSPMLVAQEAAESTKLDDHQQAITAWRAKRHERLASSKGWLTLVGLEWLNEGENRVGSAADNDIRLSGGPDYWGSVFLDDGRLKFVNPNGSKVTIDGKAVAESELIDDVKGKATVVASESLSFHVIFRESFALRIKDSKAPTLLNFKGVENYPIDESWRIDGRFIRAEKGASLEIVNVLGQVTESPIFGTFEFEMDGKTHSLLGIGTSESKSLWFIFADRTSGRGTYGAGRFLYSDSMPENGRLVVDFNKAYNPPCAFNPYSTCPLPPQRNRMDLMVTAGEKDFHPDPG